MKPCSGTWQPHPEEFEGDDQALGYGAFNIIFFKSMEDTGLSGKFTEAVTIRKIFVHFQQAMLEPDADTMR